MYLTTVVPVGHCILAWNSVYLVFPPVMLDMPKSFFFARPGNVLNIGTTIKAIVYMKYLKTVYLSYFLEVGLSVSNAGHILKMIFHKFEF